MARLRKKIQILVSIYIIFANSASAFTTVPVSQCNLYSNVVLPKFHDKNFKDSIVSNNLKLKKSILFDFKNGNSRTRSKHVLAGASSSNMQKISRIDNKETFQKKPKATASKRQMLLFAIPALGIFLSSPLLSNIDNAFVGRLAGTAGLAALSPATLCIDQILYLFSFLSRATTGLVARAYARPTNEKNTTSSDSIVDIKNTKAACEAASAPLTVSLIFGLLLTIMYAVSAPRMLAVLNVQSEIRHEAASYIYWRGCVSWAALAQSVSLSILLATKDAITPLKIVLMAAVLNIIGDAFFCAWPFNWGCAGAAAATSIATLVSSGFLLRALKTKQLLPRLKIPTKKEMFGLLEFTGPLLAITLTRLIGFVSMQRRAMSLGLKNLAGFQLCINVTILFLLFGEPLSQLSQTRLPALVDRKDGDSIMANIKSIAVLTCSTAFLVGGLAYLVLTFGSSLFTSDLGVQQLARITAPAVFMAVAQAIITTSTDGAMLASRDFGYMFLVGVSTCATQLALLKRCSTIGAIFGTFTLRLAIYAIAVFLRAGLGYGDLGRAIKSRSSRQNENER